MGLYDRWAGDAGAEKISVHGFSAALRELARGEGDPGSITKAQVVSAFGLNTAEETELDAIIAKYNSQSNAQKKGDFVVKLHDVMILVEEGFYGETKAKSELGF